MMVRIVLIALVGLLAGCAGLSKQPEPALQRVEVPIAVSCVKDVPAKPALPAVPATGIFDQVKALVARDKLRDRYEAELVVVIDACR